MDANHACLNQLGVGHEKLDVVVQIAKTHGLNAKLTGAGGGGCAFVMMSNDTAQETVQQLIKDLEQEGFCCYQSVLGGAGITYQQTA